MKNRDIWITWTLVFTLLLGVYLLVFSGMGVTDDEQLFSVLSGSLASGQGSNSLPLYGNDRLRAETGNLEPLHALFNMPFYALAKAAGWGRAQAQHLPAGIYTAASAALLAAIALRRGYAKSSALTLALAFGLGTIAFPYARTNFREPLAMLCLTGAAFCLERLNEPKKSSLKYFAPLLGMFILLGLAALTKVTCGLCLPFFAAAGWLNLRRNAKCPTSQILKLLIFCLLVGLIGLLGIFVFMPESALRRFSLDFITSMLVTMTRIPHGYFWQALAGMLVSPGKGLLLYSPVLILAFSPLLRLAGRPRSVLLMKPTDDLIAFGSLAVLMLMQALIYDQYWWGITWSTRALLPALPLLMLAALPALDAGLHSERKHMRTLMRVLLAMSLLILRQVRKTDVRLTASTSSHASSFIRMIKPSRVIPALLTKTSSRSVVSLSCSSIASTCMISARSAAIRNPSPISASRAEAAAALER